MTGTVVEPVQVSDAAAAEVAALHAAVADLKATITGTVPRKVGAAIKNATARVAAKVPANTVAKVAYGGVRVRAAPSWPRLMWPLRGPP